MKILYIGIANGSSLNRYNALNRLGHDVFLIDPFSYIPSNRVAGKWIFETGAFGLIGRIKLNVLSAIEDRQFDLVFVNGGNVIGPGLVKELKKKVGVVVNYNNDDPFSRSEWRKWRLYRDSIPEYDLLVVVRYQNISEVKALGANKVLRVFMSADEVTHSPMKLTSADRERWAAEVAFVGTWMPERGPFIAKLLEQGIQLSIWGDRWYKAKEWKLIRNVWRGPGIYTKEYIKPIIASKICLGLLSKGNRDLHTMRSIEIPAIGGLLCAERTKEHLALYNEGEEAVFWDNADECAVKCVELLKCPTQCEEIAKRGHERCLKNNFFNEPILSRIIEEAMDR